MSVKVHHEELSTHTPPLLTIPVTVISETSTAAVPTIPPTIPSITHLPQQSTPTPTPAPSTTSIHALLDFSSLFGFNQRVFILEKELSQLKQAFRSYIEEFEKKAKDKRKRYIDLVEKSVKDIIKDEVKTSLIEFELKKILLDKIQKSKSYRAAQEHRDLYDALVKYYKLDKDLFKSYGLMKRKTRKDAELSKGSKSKESKSSSSKGIKCQSKLFGKLAQAEEPVFETTYTKMPPNQGSNLGNIDDQPNVEADSKHDCKIAKSKKPPLTFEELMSIPIDFSAYVMNNLKTENLKQEHLVGPSFNLHKGTCRSRVELEYHFKECYKVVTDRIDWNNPEGQKYPFDLSKTRPLIEDQGCQVVHVNYFINNDLKYLKGRSSSSKYTTFTTITKAAKESHTGVLNDNGSIDTQATGLSLRAIEDMLLLLVQKKLSNLERDVIFDMNVALQMFTRRVVILKRVEDHQLGVENYQKKLNITKPKTFRSEISKRHPYNEYSNLQGIIYVEKFKRNRLMRSDKLYKFSDGTLIFVRQSYMILLQT
nr:hypothetical protein [Tanacetum cinerariifolium]